MSEETKLIRVSTATWNCLRELSSRSGVDMKDFLDEFGIQTKQALNDLDAGKILYLWSYDLKNKMVHLYLGNAVNLGIPVELPEIEVLAAFDYVREPKSGRIIDVREEPEFKPQLELIKKQIEMSKK